jgi:methionyl-tRNA formyltransferase
MQRNEGLDTGDMLIVRRFDVADGTTSGQLHDYLAQEAGALVLEALDGTENGTIPPITQPETGVTYAKKILKSEAAIDWNLPAAAVRQQVLGLNPAPGAYFIHENEAIKILDATLSTAQGTPATVLDDQLTIACGTGSIRPLILQRPGKKPLGVAEFLRGFPLPPGTILMPLCPASN